MSHSYAKEKFGIAINTMITGTGDIKERLWHAYLSFHTLSQNDFSGDLKEDWNFIYTNLTTEEPTYNLKGEPTIGKVENTIAKMDKDLCIKIAERIYNLYVKLQL